MAGSRPRKAAPELPYEIWLAILRYYELQPLEFGRAKLDSGFTARRSVLWTLCLVSPRLLDIARPLLYANIVLPLDGSNASGRQCLRLLRAVSHNPQLGKLVSSLAVPLQPSLDVHWWDVTKGILQIQQAHDDYRLLFEEVKLPYIRANNTKDDQGAQQKLVALLIYLLPNLQRLLIHAPRNAGVAAIYLQDAFGLLLQRQGDSLVRSLEALSISRTSSQDASGHAPTTKSRSNDHRSEPFRSLELVQLQQEAAYEQPGLIHIDPQLGHGLDGIVPILKARSGRLKSLGLSDHCLMGVNKDPTAGTVLAQLEGLNLINLEHPSETTTILHGAERLETLSLDLTQRIPRLTGELPSQLLTESNDDYNIAILERKDTLRSLSFTAPYFQAQELGYLLGPLERMTCLRDMTNLQFLRIEPHLLIDWLEVNTWPKFLDNMPRNLLKLALRFSRREEEYCHRFARSGVGAALRSGERWKAKMPRLQAICLEPLTYGLRVAEELREALHVDGITLTWVYEV